ncbi:hypothetical protein HK098_001020 [Nowakowskiella sp. JEL0407]|nr:hypothetical protein HK098_001020 [Nowakowskiella sp. JEL0407]
MDETMELLFPNYTSPTGTIAAPKQREFLDLLAIYFNDSQYENFCKLCPPTSPPTSAHQWFPISYISKLKRVKNVSTDPTFLTQTIQNFASSHFELSPDASHLRRILPFKISTPELTIREFVVFGFPFGTSTMDVQVHFQQHAKIESISELSPTETPHLPVPTDSKIFKIRVFSSTELIHVLAQTHEYEDSELFLLPFPNSSQNSLNIIPSSSSSQKFDEYAYNRIIQFGPFDPSTILPHNISTFFSSYGTVSSVHLQRNAIFGYVEYSKSVATQVLGLMKFDGGCVINGEVINCRVLEGEEEKLFWEVQREKKRVGAEDMISLGISVQRQRVEKGGKGKRSLKKGGGKSGKMDVNSILNIHSGITKAKKGQSGRQAKVVKKKVDPLVELFESTL